MAIQVTTEERLRLKTRARQRLLGAVVLLIATAIVLPLLLDQSPRPLNSDVVIDMPEIKTAPQPVRPPIAAYPPAKPATVVPAAAPSSSPAPLAEKAQVMVPRSSQSDPGLAQPVASSHKKTDKIVHAQQTGQQAETDKPVRQAAGMPLAIDHPASAKAPSAPKNANDHLRYVVQLGAFSSAANVRQLCDRLKKAGVTTYTETLPSGSTRVRAGPYASYALADKTLAKISMAGIQAQIVPLSH